jgi:hypothetical protein
VQARAPFRDVEQRGGLVVDWQRVDPVPAGDLAAGELLGNLCGRQLPGGMLIAARRNAEPGSYYWRITQFLMPFYTIIPPYGPSPVLSGHGWVPVDDETTMAWTVT